MMMFETALAAAPLANEGLEDEQRAKEIRTEYLPFTVRSVHFPQDVQRAARLRQSAYARHLPQFAERLREPELADTQGDTVVLLAEAKLDGTPLATMRIHTNVDGKLPLEQAVSLPEHLRSGILAESVRLAIVPGREGHLPRDAIFKAFYLACVALHVDWIIICARPPLDKLYKAMHYEDISEKGELVPLPYAADIPHRVLCCNVKNAENVWREHKHPLYNFFHTNHPDIEDFRVSCRALAEKILKKKTNLNTEKKPHKETART